MDSILGSNKAWLLSTIETAFAEPSSVGLAFAIVMVFATGLFHVLPLRRVAIEKRQRLTEELQIAEAKVRYLKEKLKLPDSAQEEVRIFMDGAFDLLHYGHMNAFRLARSLGTHLVVGVNSDESISQCKGKPLCNDTERLAMVKMCKFVDEVVPDCPYVMSPSYLEWIIDTYKIDYVVHGDDPCIVDGKDVYESAKAAGKFRTIPRTEGVSTTDIVGRLLLMTKEHHFHTETTTSESSHERKSSSATLVGKQSKFLTTSLLLKLFSTGIKAPKKGMRIIYIDGAWDLFHPGHVAILEAARARGDYLIVGIHGDSLVNQLYGMNLPLMNIHERVLSVLGCRYVDDVLIDAPYEISPEMIATLNISEVCLARNSDVMSDIKAEERFKHAKEASLFTYIDSPVVFNLSRIFERIHQNQEAFEARFERKMTAERDFYKQKHSG